MDLIEKIIYLHYKDDDIMTIAIKIIKIGKIIVILMAIVLNKITNENVGIWIWKKYCSQ